MKKVAQFLMDLVVVSSVFVLLVAIIALRIWAFI